MIGYIPEAARVIRAAKYLNCTPFELLQHHVGWVDLALMLESLEDEAANDKR